MENSNRIKFQAQEHKVLAMVETMDQPATLKLLAMVKEQLHMVMFKIRAVQAPVALALVLVQANNRTSVTVVNHPP